MGQKITMKTIADAVGTSVGTVDRALNDRGRINCQMKAKILQVAEELQYRPNLGAKQLRKKSLFYVLIITRKVPSHFYYALNQGFEDALDELLDFGVQNEYIFSDTMSNDEFLCVMNQLDISRYDACIIDAAYPGIEHFADRIRKRGILSVAVHSNISYDHFDSAVGIDAKQCGELAANCFAEYMNDRCRECHIITDSETELFCNIEKIFVEMLSVDYPNLRCSTITKADFLGNPQQIICAQNVVFLNHYIDAAESQIIKNIDTTREVKLLCFGLDNIVSDLLESGHAFATIYDNPYYQGYRSVKCAIQQLIRNYDSPDEFVSVPVSVIFRKSLPYLPSHSNSDSDLVHGDYQETRL